MSKELVNKVLEMAAAAIEVEAAISAPQEAVEADPTVAARADALERAAEIIRDLKR